MDNQKAEDLGYYAEDYQDTEAFEYLEDDLDEDESIEAFDEDDLDDDEAYDAEDFEDYESFEDYDDDEAAEAYLEDDLDDEEAYEVEDGDDDEAYDVVEYDDDDEAFDEGYADTGEAVAMDAAERRRRSKRRSASARRRDWIARQKAIKRARFMKMRARAARRKATRTAKRTQHMLHKKLRGIRGRGRVSMPKISKALGTGYVWAILPNGRRTKMMFKPALATRTDMNRLTRQIRTNSVKQTKALRVHAKNIKLLKSAQSTAAKSLTAQQLKSTKLLTKQIVDGDKNLDKRITKLVSSQKKSGRKQDRKMLGQIRRQQRRSTWNTVLAASAIPLFAAYGDRAYGDNASPFTKKNLFIAGSTTLFLAADDIIDRYVARGGKKWRKGTGIWNIAAPFANWGLVYAFMRNRQHERFVTGVEHVTGTDTQSITLPVGNDINFESFEGDPVVVTTVHATSEKVQGVEAKIENGKLNLKLIGENLVTNSWADVAWEVDTLDPKYQRKKSAS
ncbi:MAG: hypothetical protein HKP58_04860 [Desulfatitalea sp.]|nr:hypothetical protein [Desulfatitalea sp.]NNJ99723.1 hypothetical protein [Desulfatitalea sp.]